MPDKPRPGRPCNHCGWCCKQELCAIGRAVWGELRAGPCPALRMSEGGLSRCGLAEQPANYVPGPVSPAEAGELSAAAVLIIGADLGCDAIAAGERSSVRFDRSLAAYARRNRTRLKQAAATWGLVLSTSARAMTAASGAPPMLRAGLGPPPFAVQLYDGTMRQVVHRPAAATPPVEPAAKTPPIEDQND